MAKRDLKYKTTPVKIVKHESKWHNTSQNGKTRVEMVKRESKWQNATQNRKMRVKMAKRESNWQNADQNGKTQVKRQNTILKKIHKIYFEKRKLKKKCFFQNGKT